MSKVPYPLPEPKNHLPEHIKLALDLEVITMIRSGYSRNDACRKYGLSTKAIRRSIQRQEKREMIAEMEANGIPYVEEVVVTPKPEFVYRLVVLPNTIQIWKEYEKHSYVACCFRKKGNKSVFNTAMSTLVKGGISQKSMAKAFEYIS